MKHNQDLSENNQDDCGSLLQVRCHLAISLLKCYGMPRYLGRRPALLSTDVRFDGKLHWTALQSLSQEVDLQMWEVRCRIHADSVTRPTPLQLQLETIIMPEKLNNKLKQLKFEWHSIWQSIKLHRVKYVLVRLLTLGLCPMSVKTDVTKSYSINFLYNYRLSASFCHPIEWIF